MKILETGKWEPEHVDYGFWRVARTIRGVSWFGYLREKRERLDVPVGMSAVRYAQLLNNDGEYLTVFTVAQLEDGLAKRKAADEEFYRANPHIHRPKRKKVA